MQLNEHSHGLDIYAITTSYANSINGVSDRSSVTKGVRSWLNRTKLYSMQLDEHPHGLCRGVHTTVIIIALTPIVSREGA